MKTLLTLSLLTFAAFTAACNTVNGVGRDIERGGEHIQNATH